MPRKKGKEYDKILLQAAVREVQRGKSFSKVARTFCIPKTTLYDHSKGHLRNNHNKP
jgi:DNA-binding phage protein